MAGLACGLASQIALPDMARGMAAPRSTTARPRTAARLLLPNGLVAPRDRASGVAGLDRAAPGPTATTPGRGGPPRARPRRGLHEAPTEP